MQEVIEKIVPSLSFFVSASVAREWSRVRVERLIKCYNAEVFLRAGMDGFLLRVGLEGCCRYGKEQAYPRPLYPPKRRWSVVVPTVCAGLKPCLLLAALLK